MSSETPGTRGTSEEAPADRSQHGFVAWLVFILAIGVVLAVVSGCMAAVYAPVFG